MPDQTYVARFGWTVRDLLLFPFCIVFVVGGAVMVKHGQLVGVLACLMGAGYIGLSITAWVSHRVALAVTAEGITLGLIPPWPASRSAFVPWSDVEAVVLWRQRVRYNISVQYIGVVRRADAPPLPGSARSSTLRTINKALVPAHLSEDLVADSRQVSFWRLDKTRLTAAVKHFSPNVQVVDQS